MRWRLGIAFNTKCFLDRTRFLPAVMVFAPTCLATSSRALDIFFSFSLRSQSGRLIIRPFSPVWRRLSSSSSVRKRPCPTTPHGASDMPVSNTLLLSMAQALWSGERTLCTGHGDNFAFEIPLHDIPKALINHERCLPMISGILVRLGHNPSGCIRNT